VPRVIVVFKEADPQVITDDRSGEVHRAWPTTLINHVGRLSLRVTVVGIEPPANEAKLVVRPARMHLIHPQREAVALLPVKQVLSLDQQRVGAPPAGELRDGLLLDL